ncbi:penicillin-binding protein [Peptacetobacter hominis]|uniref:Penicillin-binding protein n=1 Tax=Peptacetobacter hominis TaxID=2743610 RepID=A0A544QTU7_9FIRM|nr:penicillin-binding transpeptidase domain-containing protein [Peptacetobacter hominis]TQQ84126.1 penicillin-binding protein [Peptacetobacter hominis]
MENNNIPRLDTIRKIVIVVFAVILLKILYLTTIKYSHYMELAENKTYKNITVSAPRGEIRDRYGRLLAGNKNQFTVNISGDTLNKKDSEGNSSANEVALNLINLLEKNGEEYIDEFPIYVENGKYFYTYDKNINDFKKQNNIPLDYNAKETFYRIVDNMISQGILKEEDRDLDPVDLQSKLNDNGSYPPILVSEWKFTDQRDKQDWLESYKIDKTATAREAFLELRNNESLGIDKSLSDEDARKVMVVRNLVKSQGYSRYNPVTIATDVKEKTIAQIEENAINLQGVYVDVQPVRYYPNKELASHVLGYVGKIPSVSVDEYVEKGYKEDDKVGLSGIEKYYEDVLKGEDGYKQVQVDSLGRVSKEIDSKEPESGDTVYLSFDIELQKVAEDALEQSIKAAQSGATLKSKLGDVSAGTTVPKAKSGAVVAIDVDSGDVLAMASYPDFDPNKFANGISSEDYRALQPENTNDILAPSALLNLATHGAFQPGSTFKMVTAMAGLDNGLDPNYTINDPGVIKFGSKTFGDYVWNHGGGNHGYTNLYKALQESCNIYFFTVATGTNWMTNQDLGIDMGADKLLEYAKLFGLDEATGLKDEIGENPGKVPNTEDKLESVKSMLRSDIDKKFANYFEGITRNSNRDEYDKKIDEIVSWADEEETPGRAETMKRLEKLGMKEDYIEEAADLVVYSYFNSAKWGTGDTFNLGIGQGENAYTPAQIARYVAAIANGGYLVNLSVVDKVVSGDYSTVTIDDNGEKTKIKFKDDSNLEDITEGMKRVATDGTGKKVMSNFPISVAAKTGSAEMTGKIPTANEYRYLVSHASSYNVNINEAKKLAEKLKQEKEKELTERKEKELKEKLEDKKTSKEEKEEIQKQLDEGVEVKLEDTDKVNASYLRKAIKELNPNLTDTDIDRFKDDYGTFTWSVAFAPADDPEIAVVCVIPQGESSVLSMFPVREVLGQYFGLLDSDELTTEQKKNMTKDQIKQYEEQKQQEEEKNTVNYGVKANN